MNNPIEPDWIESEENPEDSDFHNQEISDEDSSESSPPHKDTIWSWFVGSSKQDDTLDDEEEVLPDTLDEPVWKTLVLGIFRIRTPSFCSPNCQNSQGRDILMILVKMFHVAVPFGVLGQGKRHLHDWDLWGPLILSLLLATIFTFTLDAVKGESALIFSGVFVIIWIGSFVVTLNALLLGARLSFFQTVSVLGYCLAPLVVAALASLFWANVYYRIAVATTGAVWAIVASWGFVNAMIPQTRVKRKALVMYPVVLFYLVLGWIVITLSDVRGVTHG